MSDEAQEQPEVPDGAPNGKRVPQPPRAIIRNSGVTPPRDTKGAATVGVSGGTLIAILASGLPDGITKNVLIWLAPAATVTLSVAWVWGLGYVRAYVGRREEDWAFRRAREAIQLALENSFLTAGERAALQGRLADLDYVMVERRLKVAGVNPRR